MGRARVREKIDEIPSCAYSKHPPLFYWRASSFFNNANTANKVISGAGMPINFVGLLAIGGWAF
ncbi:MAG TPA: hypothetical protein DEB40_02835 [Elusimicrobia bacterium]|nr:hypothetical protein [Elusimicrobiota bacterium]